jgi:hypothetical protein
MMQSNKKKKGIKEKAMGYFERAVISNGYFEGAVTSKNIKRCSRVFYNNSACHFID